MRLRALELGQKIIIGLLYGALLTPLLLSSRFFFPYITTKTLYFRLVIELALVLYIWLVVADKRLRPRLSKISVAVFLYTAIILLTSIFGVNFYRSFWGNVERGEGLLTLLHVIAFFIILTGMLSDRRSWERFFTFGVLVSFASAIYALMQKFGASYVTPGDVSRVSATIGNASFYAGYLLIHIYIAIWLGLRQMGLWQKLFFWLIAAYELVILVLTGTRGALLGLMLGVLVLLILSVILSSHRRIRYASAGALLGLALFGLLVWNAKDSNFIASSGGLYRITHMSIRDITTESRLLTWRASWEGWKERFWIGYGYENFNVSFNKYFPAAIFRDSGSQIWFDRAHNIVFDVAATSGIFGLIAYLSLFVLSCWILWRYFRQDPESNFSTTAIFFVLLASYFVQNLFVFDTLGTYISFYTVLAFVGFLSAPRQVPKISPNLIPRPPKSYLAPALLLILGFAAYATVFHPAQANVKVTQALYKAALKNFPDMVNFYKEAIAENTYVTEEARQKSVEGLLAFRDDANVTLEAKNRAFREAIDQFRQAIKESPLDARNYLYLMTLYNNMPTVEPGAKEEVIRLGQKALELSPTRPQIYFEMGQAVYALGRFDEGIGYFKTAVELNDFPVESRWNLALALVIADRFEAAEKELNRVFEEERMVQISDNSLKNLARIFAQKNRSHSSLRLYEVLLKRKPKDAQLRLEFGAVLGTLCQKEEAKTKWSEAVALNSALTRDVEKLRQELAVRCP